MVTTEQGPLTAGRLEPGNNVVTQRPVLHGLGTQLETPIVDSKKIPSNTRGGVDPSRNMGGVDHGVESGDRAHARQVGSISRDRDACWPLLAYTASPRHRQSSLSPIMMCA